MQKEIKVLDRGFVRLVDSMGDDSSIVQAARVSYGKGTKKTSEDEALIRYLLRNKHTTPFEMVEFKFHIKAPIFVFRQWHRHRMWSYNEYSGRYSEMKDEFYSPTDSLFTKQNPTNKQGGTNEAIPWNDFRSDYRSWEEQFRNQQARARQDYEVYLATGVRKELARINLPLSQYSEMYAKVDLHNLFHFLKLRMDAHAQYEIRVYGDAIAEIVKNVVPIAYKAFEDYILGSTTFNFKELKSIYLIFDIFRSSRPVDKEWWEQDDIQSLVEKEANRVFSNKREREEFLQKVLPLFVYEFGNKKFPGA